MLSTIYTENLVFPIAPGTIHNFKVVSLRRNVKSKYVPEKKMENYLDAK